MNLGLTMAHDELKRVRMKRGIRHYPPFTLNDLAQWMANNRQQQVSKSARSRVAPSARRDKARFNYLRDHL